MQKTDLNELERIMKNIFMPILKLMLKNSNPELFKKWGGNFCRQTAILGCHVLSKIAPEYQWEAWDGNFKDIIEATEVKYNHAWIYGLNKLGHGMFIDLSRQHHENVFSKVKSNQRPPEIPGYDYMEELNRTKIDWKKSLEDKEYYTGLTGLKLGEYLMFHINTQK